MPLAKLMAVSLKKRILLRGFECPKSTVYEHTKTDCPNISWTLFRTPLIIRTYVTNIKERFVTEVFAYCRVSTAEQTTDNQLQEIAASGFQVDSRRIITEAVSGSVADMRRKGFLTLLNKLESGNVLVVTKWDRLGRNAMDVRATLSVLHLLGLGFTALNWAVLNLQVPQAR